jgi:hypothetical protein
LGVLAAGDAWRILRTPTAAGAADAGGMRKSGNAAGAATTGAAGPPAF